MNKLILAFLVVLTSIPVMAAEDKWVTVDRLNRRTCPDSACGVVGQLFFREKARIYEEKSGWVRISKYYDAFCQGGRSKYVDSGNSLCTPNNGINNGKFSEWVSSKYLSKNRPTDPGANAKGVAKSVNKSDDYRIYKGAFIKAAENLIRSGKCTFKELEDQGGFYKSTKYKNQPIYFTYCGGYTQRHKLHLNAATGKMF